MLDYEFLNSFVETILNVHKSIFWVGITNRYSLLLVTKTKQGFDPLLTDEEDEEFSSSSITRYTSIRSVAPKIGKTIYAFGRYQKVCRATIPINDDFYLLVMFSPTIRKFDRLIKQRIIPMIESDAHRFVMPSD